PQCLNGGRSITTLQSGQHMFCLCPDGFSGSSCEIVNSQELAGAKMLLRDELWPVLLREIRRGTEFLLPHIWEQPEKQRCCSSPGQAGSCPEGTFTPGYQKSWDVNDSASCIVGMGLRYRGPVAQTESGRECMEWDPESSRSTFGSDSRALGLGRHNRCRRVDGLSHTDDVVGYLTLLGNDPTDLLHSELGTSNIPLHGKSSYWAHCRLIPSPFCDNSRMFYSGRNPDYSRKPWCYVQGPQGKVKEYCNIPNCNRDPGENPSIPPFSLYTLSPSTHSLHHITLSVPSPYTLLLYHPSSIHPSIFCSSIQSPSPSSTSSSDSGWRCGDRSGPRLKIVGGALSSVELHPWMAAVFWTSPRQGRVFRCAGSLIAPCWVLTAAHCFPEGANLDVGRLWVVLGKTALNETDEKKEQEFGVTELYTHEHFDDTDGSFNNDIALIRIGRPDGACALESSSVRTVCVAPPDSSLPDGTSCEIAGYGKEQEGLWYNSQYLREARVNLLPQDLCSSKTYYGNMITENMLCAGAPDWSVDACKSL
ncbi:hypothetical protein NFI96_027393, partial [Prochilodus magdalenae]